MTDLVHGPVTWISECVGVVGNDPAVAEAAARLAADPTAVTVIGPRDGDDIWPSVEAALPIMVPPGGRARIVVADAGRPERGFAARLARELSGPVVAPRGDVVLVPGGTLFAPYGWFEYTAAGEHRPAGRRAPRPRWEADVDRASSDGPGRVIVRPVPAGLWIFTADPDAPMPDLSDLAYSVPMDDARPVLLIGRPGHPEPADEDVLALVDQLPPALRSRLVLAPYGPAVGTPGLAASLARRLSVPVDVSTGLPMLTFDGRLVSLAGSVPADKGNAGWWRPLTSHVSFPPHGPAQPTGSVGGLAGCELVAGRIFVLTSDWVAEVISSGLWLRSAHRETGAETVRAYPWRPSQLRIFVGVPGEPVDPAVLSLVGALVDRLPATTRRSVEIEPTVTIGAGPDLAAATLAGSGDALAGSERAIVLRSPAVSSQATVDSGARPGRIRVLPAVPAPPAPEVVTSVGRPVGTTARPAADRPGKPQRGIFVGMAVAVVALVGATGYIASLPTSQSARDTPPIALNQPVASLPAADQPSVGSSAAFASEASIQPSVSPLSSSTPNAPPPAVPASGSQPAHSPAPATSRTSSPLAPSPTRADPPSAPPETEPAPPVGSPNPSGRNLALGRAATASSTEEAGAHSAAAAVDGSTATRWSSAFRSDPQWLAVDLGSVWQVSAVELRWENAYARAYRVELSADGSAWQTVYSTAQGTGGVVDIAVDGTPARHVRLVANQRSADRYGYSVYELEVR
uniref:discoidin domain-containing protein n=1 Tax=Paractinoplanes polyasparticus TaxID=2856853 RepID=UPI001C855668|nr:discoidin domain-containing protein [Actinoplanes polyasparticus]